MPRPGRFANHDRLGTSSAYLDGGDPSRSRVRLTIQAQSLQTHNDRRDEHLRGHFLDVDNHPTITFTSTRVEQVDATSFKVTGGLTSGRTHLPIVVASPYVGVMKRLVGRALGLYLLFAIIGRFVEGMGAVECGCSADCWCRRPVLSTFRWVFPFGHRCP
jgi:hypothetical protein